MKNLILITVLALAGMNNATAIGITLDRIQFSIGDNSIEVYPPFSRFHVDNEQFPFINPNYSFDWLFSNTENLASLDGYWYMRGGELYSSANVSFTLSEPVNFSISGKIRQPDWLEDSFTSIATNLGLHASEASQLAIGRSSLPALSGILNIGEYVFRTNGYAFSTESNSEVHLLLTPVAAPDSGHSILLLGLALGVIGILRLPKALA